MEIIMLQDVDKVGEKHQVVKVKDGYGRNYLIPKGMAVVANSSNRGILAARLRSLDKKENAMLGEYQAASSKINGKTLTITAKAGNSGKIFGSVNAAQVAEALKAEFDVTIDRKKIVLEDIKEIGTFTAVVNLHKEVIANVTVEVVAEAAAVEA